MGYQGITSSGLSNLKTNTQTYFNNICSNGITLYISAVSADNIDYSKCSLEQSASASGVDLLDLVKGNCKEMYMFNKMYDDEPYLAAQSNLVDNKHIKFGDIVIEKNKVIEFIHDFLDIYTNVKEMTENEFDKMIVDIGYILSVFGNPPETLISTIIYGLNHIWSKIDGNDENVIEQMIKYGINCGIDNEAINSMNLRAQVKSANERLKLFSDTVDKLKSGKWFGDSIGNNLPSMSFPKNGVIFLDENGMNLTESFSSTDPKGITTNFKNSMYDSHVMFPINITGKDQLLRNGIRAYLSSIGFNQFSADCIFYIPLIMLQLFLSGLELDNKIMGIYKSWYFTMTCLLMKVSQNDYGTPFYDLWKSGKLPTQTFRSKDTHKVLYKNSVLNPFGMEQDEWWATCMFFLGNDLFEAQLPYYDEFIQTMKIDKSNYGLYLRTKYTNISGKFCLVELSSPIKSIFTMESFPSGKKIFKINNHNSKGNTSVVCNKPTYFSEDEKPWFDSNGCPWCQINLTGLISEYCIPSSNDKLIAIARKTASYFKVIGQTTPTTSSAASTVVPSNTHSKSSIPTSMPNLATLQININSDVVSPIGMLGGGKTVTRELFIESLKEKNKKTLILTSPELNGILENIRKRLIENINDGGINCFIISTDDMCKGVSPENFGKAVGFAAKKIISSLMVLKSYLHIIFSDIVNQKNNYNFFGSQFNNIHEIPINCGDKFPDKLNYDEKEKYICFSLDNLYKRTGDGLIFKEQNKELIKKVANQKANMVIGKDSQKIINTIFDKQFSELVSYINTKSNEWKQIYTLNNMKIKIDSLLDTLISKHTTVEVS